MTPLQAFDLWTPLAEMAPFHVAFLVAVGAAIGFCIGMTAIGGGILAVPALALGFGLDPSVCVGTASLYTFLTKIFSTYRHFKLGTIRYRISAYFLLGAIPGAGIGAWYVNARVGTQDVEARLLFQQDLGQFIGCTMLVSAAMLLWTLLRGGRDPGAPCETLSRSLAGALLGVGVGSIVGCTALGAGILGIPVLLVCFGLHANQSVGSCTLIGLALTLVSSLIYGVGGQLHFPATILMSLGSMPGVYAGSQLTSKLPETRLRVVLTSVIFLAGLTMLYA